MKNSGDQIHIKNKLLQHMSEADFKTLIENSLHAYILSNSDGCILETNCVAMNMFGYSKNEFLSLNKQNLFDPKGKNLKKSVIEIEKKDLIKVEATGIKKNGEHFPIEYTSVVYSESNGTVRMSTLVNDMSNKSYAENTIKQNYQDIKTSIENIANGYFTVNNDWIITQWHNESDSGSTIKKEEVIGKSFIDFFKDFENKKLYTKCCRAKKENISIRFEKFIEISKTWIEITIYPSESGLTVFCKNISKQKNAVAVMKISNERFDMVVKATNDLVWDWDIMTGDIHRSQIGVKRVYGHSSNDLIRTNELWAENIHLEDKNYIDRQIAYYLTSEKETSFNFEYRYKREDGNYSYINDKGYIIRNELGIVTRMIGAARDITEQKQIAINIKESEKRYKMFVEQSTEGIWRIELDKAKPISTPVEEMIEYCMENAYVAECNNAFARMYGFENADKIIGVPLNILMPSGNPVNYLYLEKFFRNNYIVENGLSYVTDKDGNQLVFVNNIVGIIEGDHIKRAWGTQRNITQQKKAEQLLLESEEQYRHLFNNNPSCIFIWDQDTLQMIEANKAAEELYGYNRKEFLQLTALDIRPVEEHAKFLEIVNIIRKNEVLKKTITWNQIKKDGEKIIMEISTHNIIYKGKKAVLAIGKNVTEKIQLENDLHEERLRNQKLITEAVLSGQEKERAELGEELHDNINQILASTRLYIECAIADENIRKDLLGKGKTLLDTAMKEIRKLSRTLLPPSLGDVSLLEALSELTNDSQQVIPIEIKKNWKNFNEDGLCQKLKLTIFRIAQEQMNNIYKHSQAKNVTISLSKIDGSIILVIKDDGIGFDTKSKRAGVGIRNITNRAEVNNGTVSIESSPGQGCKLIVQFLERT